MERPTNYVIVRVTSLMEYWTGDNFVPERTKAIRYPTYGKAFSAVWNIDDSFAHGTGKIATIPFEVLEDLIASGEVKE